MTKGNGIFAGVGQHHEFMGEVAAYGAGVSLHRAEAQAKAPEDAAVGIVHQPVADFGPGHTGIKGIGILHDKFASTHKAETGTDLISELGLYLVQAYRQLPVGAHFAAHQVSNDLLMGGAQAVFAFMPVSEAQQLLAVVLPAAGLLPEVSRLHHGHEQLLKACSVHLFAHDARHFFQNPEPQGQVNIKARGQTAHHAGAQKKLVADHLSIGRAFHGQTQQAALQKRGGLCVIQNVGRLAQLPQADAQGGGGADGVTIGAGVGQNAVVVVRKQPAGKIIPRHRAHRRADC